LQSYHKSDENDVEILRDTVDVLRRIKLFFAMRTQIISDFFWRLKF